MKGLLKVIRSLSKTALDSSKESEKIAMGKELTMIYYLHCHAIYVNVVEFKTVVFGYIGWI